MIELQKWETRPKKTKTIPILIVKTKSVKVRGKSVYLSVNPGAVS